MIAKAGQIIAIDSVKVDNTLSGDGVRTPLGVKATAPAVSGHAGLSAEKVDNTVYIGMEPEAVKVVSTNESVSIEKIVKSDGTVEYNLGVSVKPVVSDTKIIGSNGISARETAPATYTIGVSGDYVKTETLQDYYTKNEANTNFQPKGDYVEESEIQDMATKTWVSGNFVENDVLDSYYRKDEVYSKSETYKKDEVYTKQEVEDLIPDTSNFALSADVDTAIDDVCDWVEHNFQEIGDYAEKSDIDSLSATVSANFQKKGEYVTSADSSLAGKALVLKNNKWEEAPEGTVYTSGPNIKIDGTSISGRDWSPELNLKADKTEVNDKVQDLANEFDSVIDSVSATIDRDFALKTELDEKLDKSETTNWDVKEYSAGYYITIQNHKISSKDWSTEIDAKQDKLTDKQLSAISSVSAIEAMSGKWVTSGVDVIAGDYYYGLVNKDGTVEWEPIPEPDYPDIVANNGISAAYDSDKNAYDIGLSATDLAYMYDTYVNNGVSVTDSTIIKFTGNNYNHITVDNAGYFVLPETANKITFNINENIDENNPGTHNYLLNKLSLKTDKPEILVSTQNYYPAEVGSSNGTISITVDHSVDPTRKYALVYEGSDIPGSANLNITMSIVEEVTCLSDNLTNNGEDYVGVNPVTVNNDTRKVQLEYDSEIFTLKNGTELTLKAGSSDTPINPVVFDKLVDSINGRMTETIPFGALGSVATLIGRKQYAYLFRPTIEYDMTQNTVAYMFGGNADNNEKVAVAVYDASKTENNLIWRSAYPVINVGSGGEHTIQAHVDSPSGTISPNHLYYVAVRIDKDGGGGNWQNVLGVPAQGSTDIGNLRIWLGYNLPGGENLDFPVSINFSTQGSLGYFGSLKPYVGFRTNTPNA